MARTPTPSAAQTRALMRVRRALACGAIVAAAVAASVGGSQAASSNVTVTLDVLSSTTMDPSGCPASARRFGTVLPDSSVVTAAPCAISFGSSNNSSMLKLYQEDAFGDAMFARSDGSTMDAAFGPGGMRALTFPEGNADAKFGALQPDGQYVVGGRVQAGGDWDSAILRIGPTGTLDPSFGDAATGRKVHDFAPTYDEILIDGFVEPNGKVVAAGKRSDAGLNFDNTMLVRFTAAGQPDPTFGGGDGMIDVDSAGWDEWWGLTTAPGGRYVTVGCSCGFGTGDALIGRFNSDGTPDTTFSSTGIVERTWGTTFSKLSTIVPLASGKFIVGGVRDNGAGSRTYVARLNADLSLDTTYGAVGFREIPALDGGIGRISLAGTDGSVWVPGHVDASGGGAGWDAGVARIDGAGNIDTSWNATGSASANHGGASNDWGYASLSLGDSSVLVSGGSTAGSGEFHMMAFTNGGTAGLDSGFSSDGKQLLDISSGGFDYAVESFWGREGRIVSIGSANNAFGVAVFAGGGTIPDYGGGAVFGSGNTQSTFGACLEARAGAGVAGGWTVDPGGACTAVVGDPWNSIADTAASPTAKVLGSPTPGVINATATIRFGVKTALAQTPRSYTAPLVFEVIAPDA